LRHINTLELMMKSMKVYGVPPTYEYQNFWPGPRIVMVTLGDKRYWIRQLCILLRERLSRLRGSGS